MTPLLLRQKLRFDEESFAWRKVLHFLAVIVQTMIFSLFQYGHSGSGSKYFGALLHCLSKTTPRTSGLLGLSTERSDSLLQENDACAV